MLSHSDHHGQSNVAYYTQDWRPANQLPPPPAAVTQDYHHHHPHGYHQSAAGYSFQAEPGYISRVNACTWPGFDMQMSGWEVLMNEAYTAGSGSVNRPARCWVYRVLNSSSWCHLKVINKTF
uniref:Uncharacterized protein n=1 Tax=Branchiostoma floridae TaxID=7739 RepID=C3Z510_BRAFL|eukprot:XP_002596355.1 hypothetical protein BRAFLDRAFT_76164 [Branchiostoma floridae]